MTFGLDLYRAATGLLEPLAPLLLDRRAKRGKEDWAPRTDGTYEKGVAQTASA